MLINLLIYVSVLGKNNLVLVDNSRLSNKKWERTLKNEISLMWHVWEQCCLSSFAYKHIILMAYLIPYHILETLSVCHIKFTTPG